ncbi:AAA family ATPase [Halomonas stenophila]|uniref:Chromosomal replication initiation ATPase DnaA n=1 Tax=Halomonas stenophila TaxID=795312 RepID=A0A7W5EUQ8_9GAMM|nr:ATP-binding protein [Halomonas stenophila]MBB3231738.1 chromosomal replication initiation ATPase DnaA [Halomonas stenophila]
MSVNTIVPLTNVGLLAQAVESAASRPPELPGLVVMYGPSGYGKSLAAARSANLHRAYYVECRESWTKKAFLTAILREMGIIPTRTLSEMVDQVAEQLSRSGRPLIVDDVQYVIDKAAANVLTDIYNASQGTLILIGEERVPASMARLERLHNRVLEWVPAQPANLDDVRQLAESSYPDLEIDDDLLDTVVARVRGCLRRVAVNLYQIHSEALANGWNRVDLDTWGDREIHTGQPPARRG